MDIYKLELNYIFTLFLLHLKIKSFLEMFKIFKNISEQCKRRYLFQYIIIFCPGCLLLYFFNLYSFAICTIRSLKNIFRILKQIIGDLTLRIMIWLISTRSARVIWIGNGEFWWAISWFFAKDLLFWILYSLYRLFVQCFWILNLTHTDWRIFLVKL